LDNLTHSLVGLFLARAGFKRVTAYGTTILVVAANAPDIDVISWFWGRPTWLHWHRYITHSLVGAPFMALLTLAVVALIAPIARKQKVSWWPAFWIALLGVVSHLILDLTNAYGVRLLLPFSGHWSHLDITPVVDFSIWAILLLGVMAPALSRLVGSEIGETGKERGNAGWAVTALLLLTGFDYSRSVFHLRATNILNSRIYNGLAPRRVGAFPSGNPLVWRGVAEMSNAYVEVPVDLRTNFQPADEVTWYKPPRTPAMQAAMDTYPFQMLLEFVQWPLWVTQPEIDSNQIDTNKTGGTRVALIDLRFGNPSQAGFSATALVNKANQVEESVFGSGEVKAR
jgi:inner membrane protein